MNDAQARDLLAQAAALDAGTDDSLPPQDDATAEGEAVSLQNGTVDQIVQQIQENPENAREYITQIERSLGGRYGSELQQLRNEMQREKEELLRRLDEPKTPPSTEPDEHGLTEAEYARLGEVISKTKQFQEIQARADQVTSQSRDQQAQSQVMNLKQTHGDKVTDDELVSLYRVIKLSGYDYQAADVQDEYQRLLRRVQARGRTVEKDQQAKETLQERVNAGMETPISSGRSQQLADKLAKELRDDRGNITDDRLVEVGKKFMQGLDRMR